MTLTQAEFDAAVKKLENKVKELESSKDLPTPIGYCLTQVNLDSDGDEAVWVWTYLEDEDVFESENFYKRKRLRKIINEEIRKAVGDVFVYIYFRSVHEEEEDEDEEEDEIAYVRPWHGRLSMDI